MNERENPSQQLYIYLLPEDICHRVFLCRHSTTPSSVARPALQPVEHTYRITQVPYYTRTILHTFHVTHLPYHQFTDYVLHDQT